jgi:phosphoribosyl-AMP cyclohydrolase
VSEAWLEALRWNEDGLIPVIARDARSGEVLMLAWMNREALAATRDSSEAVYWSRSRKKLWKKGETSGHVQKVTAIYTDCDQDALMIEVEQIGGIACHTGRASCFYQRLGSDGWQPAAPVLKDPSDIYGEEKGR